MPQEKHLPYGHLLKDKLEAEAVAVNRALTRARRSLDDRLEKRAAEITAENTYPPLDPADQQTRATRDWLKSSAEIEAEIEAGNFSDLPPLGDGRRDIKSPAFPTVAEALRRRKRARKAAAVRLMFASAIVALGYSLIFGGAVGYVAAVFFFVGAVIGRIATEDNNGQAQ